MRERGKERERIGFYGLEKSSEGDGVGVIIFSERAGGGDAKVYRKIYLLYLDSEDNNEEEEQGKGNTEEEDKEKVGG